MSANAAGNAADAQGNAAAAGTAEQRRQFDLARRDQAPWQQTGVNALNQLAVLSGLPVAQADNRQTGSGVFKPSEIVNLLQRGNSVDDILKMGVLGPGQGSKELRYLQESGFSSDDINRLTSGTFSPLGPASGATGTSGTGGTPDYSAFYKSPDYQFALDQGTQATERSAAARGGLNSGNTLAALTQYGQGLATQNFGNYTNRLSALAGIGQSATNTLTNAGLTTGRGIANTLANEGDARASGITGQADAWGNALGDLGGIAGYYFGGRKKPNYGVGTGPY